MPDVITTPDTFYVRPLEKLLGGIEVADFPLKSTYTTADEITPGKVAVLMDGEWVLADDTTADGAFTGLFMTHTDTTIGDETAGGLTNPVVLVGPAIVKLESSVLGTGSWATSASDVVELVAAGGKLQPRAAEVTPTVAHLQKVNSDGSVIIQLLAPSSNPGIS